MNNNYYPDVDQQPEQADEAGPQPNDGKAEGETALVPKSLFGGQDVQPGQEITLKVVATHEDEVEVEPSGSANEEEAASDEGSSEMDRANGKLNALAQ